MTKPITAVDLPFADGTYRFWLTLAPLAELERTLSELAANAPERPASMLGLEWQLRSGISLTEEGKAVYTGAADSSAVKAIRETIRLALVGGNLAIVDGEEREVSPQRAKELVETYVYPERPLGEAAAMAWRILGAAVYGDTPSASSEEKADA
ncbi:hypothetical protein GCM10011371_08360 [Novosphingobium marinum]|uniref:Gene transfer agent family protein n=1 Tax=Novosphingobium marinum TaxID=1514948 RepID=A0A7Y9XU00_9SPHN|nr:hypothetical protein [Novosphingobium marinum]NYH94524.1 hypothetical protein [Novosphingobium marinum]GGC23000.1 hypothetical protein GCM10011371_08360 [Novosphingobium marinum]